MSENQPFPIPDVFTVRLLDAVSSGRVTGRIRFTLGMPMEMEPRRWMCLFNLEQVAPAQHFMGKGAAEGRDELQALLRATQVSRATLAGLARQNDVSLLWDGSEHGGLPDMGTDMP